MAGLLFSACGAPFASPNAPATPCPLISQAEYDSARAAGATSATATVSAGGVVSMQTGPGVVNCATYSSARKPCRRPNDFVIRYSTASSEVFYVRVPAGEQYRFNIGHLPNTCEIIDR